MIEEQSNLEDITLSLVLDTNDMSISRVVALRLGVIIYYYYYYYYWHYNTLWVFACSKNFRLFLELS
jgi:hypothetical protein